MESDPRIRQPLSDIAALLLILAFGEREIAEGKVVAVEEAVRRIRQARDASHQT